MCAEPIWLSFTVKNPIDTWNVNLTILVEDRFFPHFFSKIDSGKDYFPLLVINYEEKIFGALHAPFPYNNMYIRLTMTNFTNVEFFG